MLPLRLCPLTGPIFLDATHWLQPEKTGAVMVTSDAGQTWASAGGASVFAWTVDGQNWARMDGVDPDPDNPDLGNIYDALFISRDGGVTWQPADFSAR